MATAPSAALAGSPAAARPGRRARSGRASGLLRGLVFRLTRSEWSGLDRRLRDRRAAGGVHRLDEHGAHPRVPDPEGQCPCERRVKALHLSIALESGGGATHESDASGRRVASAGSWV